MDDRTPGPLITVAMPVYNAGGYLRAAVMSIVDQTYQNWELLVIDDKSTDSSLESIADIKDERIRILRDGRNLGLAARLNQAIDLAKGQYLARMDHDDVSYPDRFARQLALLTSEPELDLVAVRAILISERNKIVGYFPYALSHESICARPWRGFYLPHPTWMGRIEWFRKYRYGIPQPYFCEDQELLLRSYRDSKFACVPEIQFAYRVRDKISLKKQLKTRRTILSVQLANFGARYQLHFMLLSMLVFLLRTCFDGLRFVSGKAMYGDTKTLGNPQSREDAAQWERVRNRLFGPDDGRSSP